MNSKFFTFPIAFLAALILATCTVDRFPEKEGGSGSVEGVSVQSRRIAVVSTEYLELAQDITRPQGMHDELLVVSKDGNGMAYIERKGDAFRVVHNGQPGNIYKMIGDLTISPDGSRVAYVVHVDERLRSIVVDGQEGPVFEDAGMPLFSPDGKHLVYTATRGKEDRLVIDHKIHEEDWVSQDLVMTPNSRSIAFAVMPPGGGQVSFVISDFALQNRKVFETCGESVVSSSDHSIVAVVCSAQGSRSIQIIDLLARTLMSTIETPEGETIIRKRFSDDGRGFIYATMTEEYRRFIHYVGRTEEVPQGEEIMSDPLLLSQPERVGVIIGNAFRVHFETFLPSTGNREKEYGYISDFTASPDGRHHAYVAVDVGSQAGMRVVVDGHEGPIFDKIVSPLFSPDNRFLIYRARQEGRRFLVVSDMRGNVVRQHPDYDMVFQPVLEEDGKSVAYGVLDGKEFFWKVENL